MKSLLPHALRRALYLLLLIATVFGFAACSAHDTAERQQGISNVHQGMVDRREARQGARDERFRASRESWMN